MEIEIALAKRRDAATWQNKTVKWSWLVERCSKTTRTHETVKEYAAMKRDEQDAIKSCKGGFVGGYLAGSVRKKDTVRNRYILAIDADSAKPSFWDRVTLGFENECFIYSTHKHTATAPRYRLIFLLDRAVNPAEYEAIIRRVSEGVGMDYLDKTTFQPSRMMYWPTSSVDGDFFFDHQEGPAICADEVLATYKDYTDIAEWPMHPGESKLRQEGIRQAGNPLEKPGIIGYFNRTYPIKVAIEEHLADVYEFSETSEERYSLIGASTSNGLVIYDQLAWSNHGTDKAAGSALNSFDIIRIHKFGHLDVKVKDDTPINKYPSYLEMVSWASELKEVKLTIAAEKTAVAREMFADRVKLENKNNSQDLDTDTEEDQVEELDLDWMAGLETDGKGNYKTSYKNFYSILRNDPLLKRKYGYNLFAERVDVLGKLPWDNRSTRRLWEDEDKSGLYAYVGSAPYELKRSPILFDTWDIVKKEFSFDPVVDYLRGLEWDGKPRAEKVFIDYMGAQDCDYVRSVTRKTLLGAVWRAFVPGCKFEYVLTLTGPEGVGKSTILEKLAVNEDWFSDTFDFSMLSKGMQAYEQLQGVWITEIGELVGIKNADKQKIKNFIASKKDVYRGAYAEFKAEHKRRGILIGTTNEFDYLTDNNGNRRDWPVEVYFQEPTKDVFKLSPKTVGQLWAEVMHWYGEGEKPYLTKMEESEARKRQVKHEAKDEWSTIIEQWLDTPSSDADFGEDILRNKVCAADIWTKALGGMAKDINSHNTKRIHGIMKKMKGWEPTKSKIMFHEFGQKQRGYIRSVSNVSGTLLKDDFDLN